MTDQYEFSEKTERKGPSVYDEQLHPLVERMALICKQNELPIFLTIEESPGQARTTCMNAGENSIERMKNLYDLNLSVDIDEFFRRIIARAHREGHDSKYLRAMGIPLSPNKNKKK